MNIMLSARAAVHLSNANEIAPACGVRATGSVFTITDKAVTCFRCIRIIEHREAETDRIAYYAGLADQQDMDYSQAPAKDEIPAETLANERCCEHSPMYHGARGCDTCGCNTPRNVMPQAGNVTVGRNVQTDRGRVPFTAELVEAVSLSWIPLTRPSAIITATDGEVIWVYVQTECAKARTLYVGSDAADAAKSAVAYTVQHTNYVATLAKTSYGESLRVIPTPVTRTIYGPIPAPASAEYETDPRTGLPVVTVFDVRYVIGIQQSNQYGDEFVEFWEAGAKSFGFGTVFRADANGHPGTVRDAIWNAHRRIRNV